MRRETANVLLVLLGGALLKIAWNDTYLRYVKPSLLPFLVATGVVIVALGVLAITRDIRVGCHGCSQRCCSPGLVALGGDEVRVAGMRRSARSMTLGADEDACSRYVVALVLALLLLVVIFCVFVRLVGRARPGRARPITER